MSRAKWLTGFLACIDPSDMARVQGQRLHG